ncbi:MAG: hypothetical protein RIC95_01015 [Vicingaceae bacterium]
MKKTLSIFFFTLCFIGLSAQDSLEFQFDKARALLAKREIKPAIEALRYVYVQNPEHSNINFLMGAAYTELSGHQKEALYHLKKAAKNINESYIVGSFQEKGAPLHTFYYLTVALVEDDQCAAANQAFLQFKKYRESIDDYYIAEADRHLQKCPFEESESGKDWNLAIEPPSDYQPNKITVKQEVMLDSAALAERGMVVQRLEYTTNAPLYGVQIGSNINPSPISSYGNLKNVDVFVDNKGMIRYVVGHFSYYSQAESLLKTLQSKGYGDAFIVNVNDERKYANELISYQNVNLRAGIKGEVEFYVQMGAFKENIPEEVMEVYLTVEQVEEIKYEEVTIIAVGPFENHEQAVQKLDRLKSEGFDDAYIVAFNKGKKIPLDAAINYSK